MVGGVKLSLESNPKPTRDAWKGSNKTLCAPGPRDSTDRTRPACKCLSVSRGMGQQWPATGAGSLGAADLGHTAYGLSPLGGNCH